MESLYVEAHEPPLAIRRDKLALQYILKLQANPENPAYDVVFNPKHQDLYRNKELATNFFGIHCKKLLKEAKIDVGEIAINNIPDVPIWDSKPVTVDFIYVNLTSHLLLLLFLKVDLMSFGRNTRIFFTFTLTDLKVKEK